MEGCSVSPLEQLAHPGQHGSSTDSDAVCYKRLPALRQASSLTKLYQSLSTHDYIAQSSTATVCHRRALCREWRPTGRQSMVLSSLLGTCSMILGLTEAILFTTHPRGRKTAPLMQPTTMWCAICHASFQTNISCHVMHADTLSCSADKNCFLTGQGHSSASAAFLTIIACMSYSHTKSEYW